MQTLEQVYKTKRRLFLKTLVPYCARSGLSAEDLLHDAIVQFLDDKQALDIASYLYVSARNFGINRCKQLQNRKRLDVVALLTDNTWAFPESGIAAAQTLEILNRILNHLAKISPHQYKAFMLYVIEDHSLNETAKLINCAKRNVLLNVSHAIEFCRERLNTAQVI